MMDKTNNFGQRRQLRYLHEILFSLNVAFLGMSFVLLFGPSRRPDLASPFFAMEAIINRSLHIQQTDFIRGYFAFYLPSLAVAACIWVLLRLLANTDFAHMLLKQLAGLVAILAAPGFFLFVNNGRLGSEMAELVPVAAIAVMCFRNAKALPTWVVVVVFAAHNVFWFWQFGFRLSTFNYSGPLAPIACFFSATAWLLYLLHPGREKLTKQT